MEMHWKSDEMEQLIKELQEYERSPVRLPVRRKQEPWDVGAGNGYERERQADWDAREMRTATTKVRREVYEEFRRMCQERRRTPYSVLQELLLAWMREEAREG